MSSLLPRELCFDRCIVQSYPALSSLLGSTEKSVVQANGQQQILATACIPFHDELSQAVCHGVHSV